MNLRFPQRPEPPIANEPTLDELVEARERVDAGLRLAFPELLADAFNAGIAQEEADQAEEDARASRDDLLDARSAVYRVAMRTPLEGNQSFHRWLNDLINAIGVMISLVSERSGS